MSKAKIPKEIVRKVSDKDLLASIKKDLMDDIKALSKRGVDVKKHWASMLKSLSKEKTPK